MADDRLQFILHSPLPIVIEEVVPEPIPEDDTNSLFEGELEGGHD